LPPNPNLELRSASLKKSEQYLALFLPRSTLLEDLHGFFTQAIELPLPPPKASTQPRQGGHNFDIVAPKPLSISPRGSPSFTCQKTQNPERILHRRSGSCRILLTTPSTKLTSHLLLLRSRLFPLSSSVRTDLTSPHDISYHGGQDGAVQAGGAWRWWSRKDGSDDPINSATFCRDCKHSPLEGPQEPPSVMC
jgi:hypothetical protein